MQTTPSLEVASATFLRPECGHAQLFHPEYKRCFPHCCPEHIDRSYCGASLSVRVELLKSQSLKEEPKNSSSGSELLAVFARFEALGDVTLKPDDCVEVHKMEDGTQTETNPDAQWLVMAIRTPETPLEEQKPLFFHLNSKANARWYYDWESGANKAQRLMKHALKAYLVQRCAVDGEGNFVAPSAPKAQTQLYRVVHKFEDRLNQQVFKRTELRSVDNVAEEIISAVYAHEYFHARRPNVREILSGQNFAGWHAFVAQMRQTYINSSECPGVPRAFVRRQPTLSFGEAHPPRNSAENAWNAEWILDVDEAVWKFSEAVTKDIGEGRVGHVGDDDGSVSLFSLLEVISFMVRLEVAIDVQARTLHARSTLGVAGPLDCLRVVMDGKERVFSTFPNGMTSSLDVGTHGDYIAEVQVEHSERLVVYLQLFKWSVREDAHDVGSYSMSALSIAAKGVFKVL
uniref:Uncharacterized protein n=1 Tax=Phytophthora ramorum TaxID=164328 RepID=H3GME4_PHYRM